MASVLLAGQEYRLHRKHLEPLIGQAGKWAGAIAPTFLSWAAFIGGAVLLLSGAMPAVESRIGELRKTVPLRVVELSHFAGSVAGAALLLVARGLQRRLGSAW